MQDAGETLNLTDIVEDKNVEVYLKPRLYTVTIRKFGEGTVSPSKTLYYLQNYKNITQTPAPGWVTVKIVVDDEVIFEHPLLSAAAEVQSEPEVNEQPEAAPPAQSAPEVNEQPEAEAPTQSEPETEEQPEAEIQAQSETEPEEQSEVKTEEKSEVKTEEQPETKAEEQPETTAPAKAASKVKMKTSKVQARIPMREIDDILNIDADHEIEVYFEKDDGTLEPLPNPEETCTVDVTLKGGVGEILSGPAVVEKGGKVKVEWDFDANKYELAGITINGEEQELPEGNDFDLTDITNNKDVVITLKEKKLKDNDITIPGNIDEKTHNITAAISGATGTISGSGTVADGADREIVWTVDDDTLELAYIFVNGKAIDITGITGNTLLLKGISEDKNIVVVMKAAGKPPVNVDKDGDGEPDEVLIPAEPVDPDDPDDPNNSDDPGKPGKPNGGKGSGKNQGGKGSGSVTDGTPATGDSTHLMLWIMILISDVILGCAAFVFVKKKILQKIIGLSEV